MLRSMLKAISQENMHKSQKVWKPINEIQNKVPTRNNLCINQILDKGVIHTDPPAINNTFNNYFPEVGPSMAKDILLARSNFINNITSTPYSFYLSPITEEEILYHIRNINSRKFTGINNIPIKFIKIASVVVTPQLTNLYNDCISKGVFPDILKISQLTPIYKKGPKNKCSNNYRPITLLSPFSKIFEKCLYSQLINFLNKKNLVTSSQYGFRSKYSYSMSVSKISSEIIKSIDNRKIACSIFLDLAKAFGTVDHEILFKKMEIHGIRGITLQLFNSYLSTRKMFMLVNGISSKMNDVTCGIPQGSTLDPLLFTLYVNDLPSVTKFNVKLFADDTNLTMSHCKDKELRNNVNNELENICDWMRCNKLSIIFFNY